MRFRCTRILLCPVLLGLLSQAGCVQPAVPPAAQQPKPSAFRFAVITDTHIDSPATVENLRRFLYTLQGQNLDFVLILGDISSYAPDRLRQAADVVRTSKLKVYPVAGNRDNQYGARPEWYRSAFGESCYAFDHKGWRFIVSDSFNPPPAEWLDKQLATPTPDMPIVFCQHAPPSGQTAIDQPPWSQLVRHANVKTALTGHLHRRESGTIDPIPYEVFKECFLQPPANPGTWYIAEVRANGTMQFSEHAVADLEMVEPPDALPTVVIETPAGGQVLRNGTTVRGTAGDDRGIRRVECSIDWGDWQPARGTRQWRFPLDTAALPDGNHFLRLRAIDSAGQPSVQLASLVVATDNRAPDRVFRLQQGRDGYAGCCDTTVRQFPKPKAADGHEGADSDLECWVWDKGKDKPTEIGEFSEFYIRFDLAKAGIPADARIQCVRLVLSCHRQNNIDPEGQRCNFRVAVLDEDWQSDMTFASRPARPAWQGQAEMDPPPALRGTWPERRTWQTSQMPQPVTVDLAPIRDKIQQWLRDPAVNHGLVFSPVAGRNHNISFKGSECDIVIFRPMLEIEIAAGD